ncbi:trypsin [Sarotherodon galilaeus]
MPRAGNDLEALQIHLCFCRSNLHPQRTARSGSTLVSAVSNIYLSQQTGEKPGSCWRLLTGRQSYQLAACSLPAVSCFVKRI